MVGPLSFGDILLIVLAIISGMLALYRGLTREVLSLVAWAAAAGSAFYFFTNYKEFAVDLAKTVGGPPLVSLIGVAAVIFLFVLIVVHVITMRISDSILDRQLGMVDRILGLAFGLARAFILVVIPFMFYESFVPKPEDQFEWVAKSKSLGYVKDASDTLRNALLRAVETYYPDAIPDPAAPNQQGSLTPGRMPHAAGVHIAALLYAYRRERRGDQPGHMVKHDGPAHEFVVRAAASAGAS